MFVGQQPENILNTAVFFVFFFALPSSCVEVERCTPEKKITLAFRIGVTTSHMGEVKTNCAARDPFPPPNTKQ